MNQFTPAQTRVFNELLAVGSERPIAPVGVPEELRAILEEGTQQAVAGWSEPTFFLGKSSFAAMGRCEGLVLAESTTQRTFKLPLPTAVGITTHRAIQMSHTHRDRTVGELVRMAIAGSMSEQSFAEFYADATEWQRSELESEAVNRTVAFLDTFPPLESGWTPRFEASINVKVGRLTLGGKPDLMLGRPRSDGRQTMFIADVKTGEIRDDHLLEAHFYALLSTIRHGVMPFRSTVLSLASGEWTTPDIDADVMRETAHRVVDAVVRRINLLSENVEATLTPDRYCSWCPVKNECPAASDNTPESTPVEMTLPTLETPAESSTNPFLLD